MKIHKYIKKSLCILLTMVLLFSNIYLQTVFSDTEYEYVDSKGEIKRTQAAIITNSTSVISGGWYIVSGNVSTTNLKVSGTVNLILADGSSLTASATGDNAGINLEYNHTLNIYGQSSSSGKITAKGSGKGSGIGGNGGADGGLYKLPENGESCGELNIYGGNINANRIGGGDGGVSISSTEGYYTGGKGGYAGKINLYRGVLNVSGNLGGGNGGRSDYRRGGDGGGLIRLAVFGGILKAGSIGGGTGGNGTYSYIDYLGTGYRFNFGTGGNGGNGGTVDIYAGKVDVSGYLGGGNAGWSSSLPQSTPGGGGNGSNINISGGVTNVSGITGGGSASSTSGSKRGSDGSLSITGGSFISRILLVVPKNGSSNGNAVVYPTAVSLEGIITNEHIRFILTGTSYNYGTKDLKTDLSGKVNVWLPSEVSVTNAYTSSKGYQGSVPAGSSGMLSELPLDTVKPLVSSVSPANNSMDQALSGKVIIKFNEIMNDIPGSIFLSPLSGSPIELHNGIWSSNNTVYTLNYSGLSRGETYKIQIYDFRDLTGNIMNDNLNNSFNTILPIPYFDITYIDENNSEKTASAQLLNSTAKTISTGWYALSGNLNLSDINISGNVNLILTDGYTLNVTGTDKNAAIRLTGSSKLTIYRQLLGTGILNATSSGKGAGIGGNAGTGNTGEDCGTLVINGGTVNTNRIGGGDGSDISFFSVYRGGKGGTVVINGGVVSVSGRLGGGDGGNGIPRNFMGGNGGDGSNLTISGGTITVLGKVGGGAAGMGSNMFDLTASPGGAGTCTITGGSFKASSIQPVPKNGSANGNQTVYRTIVKLKNVNSKTAVKSIFTDMVYIYGAKDVISDTDGSLYFWIPSDKTVSSVFTDNLHYKGSVLSGSQGELVLSVHDTTLPLVESFFPARNSSDIPNSGNITVRFNRVMDMDCGSVVLSSPDTDDIVLTKGIWTYSGTVYTASYSDLSYLSEYTAQFEGFCEVFGLEAEIDDIEFTIQKHPKQIIISPQDIIPISSVADTVRFSFASISIDPGKTIALNNINDVTGLVLNTSSALEDYGEIEISTSTDTPSGSHPLSITIDGTTSDIFYIEISPAVHDISVSQSDEFIFPEITAGYGTIEDSVFSFENTGNVLLGEIFIDLQGEGKDSFVISGSQFVDINPGETVTFGVRPADGLKPGIYNAIVVLSGTEIESKTFNIGFAVKSRTGNSILEILSPGTVKFSGTNIMITVESDTSDLVLDLNLSPGASWQLFNDVFFTDEVSDKTLSLSYGINMAFIKVTAENGRTNNYALSVYRKELLLTGNPGSVAPSDINNPFIYVAVLLLSCLIIVYTFWRQKKQNVFIKAIFTFVRDKYGTKFIFILLIYMSVVI